MNVKKLAAMFGNALPANSSERAANFAKWQDEFGEAITGYHGGDGKVYDFSRGPNRGNLGAAYFTDTPSVAQKYALLGGIDDSMDTPADYASELIRARRVGNKAVTDRKPSLTKAHIAVRPLDPGHVSFQGIVDAIGKEKIAKLVSEDTALDGFLGGKYDEIEDVASHLVENNLLVDYLKKSYGGMDDGEWANFLRNDTDSLIGEGAPFKFLAGTDLLGDYLKAKNLNGVIYNDLEAGGRTIVPQFPQQIKSVNNRGTFDPNDPNIYRAALPFAAGAGLMSMLPSDAEAVQRIREKDAPLEDAWNPLEAFAGGVPGGLKAAAMGVLPDGAMDWAFNRIGGLMSGGGK